LQVRIAEVTHFVMHAKDRISDVRRHSVRSSRLSDAPYSDTPAW